MDEDNPILQWRREKLKAMAAKLGGNAVLGRKLGYKDGSFVGQMISGVRPITEKTINAAEQIHGYAGWFQPKVQGHAPAVTVAPAPRESAPEPKGREPSESQWALLEDFEILPEAERQTLRARLAERARAARQAADDLYFKPNNIPAPVSDARVQESLLAGGSPPPPGGVAGYKKITPIPAAAPSPVKKVK